MRLDNQILALIAVGASVSANCQPCLEHNVNTALKCGADAQQIAEAIEVGKRVRRGAATEMDKYAYWLGRAVDLVGHCGHGRSPDHRYGRHRQRPDLSRRECGSIVEGYPGQRLDDRRRDYRPRVGHSRYPIQSAFRAIVRAHADYHRRGNARISSGAPLDRMTGVD